MNKVDMDKYKTFLLEPLINDMRISDSSSNPADEMYDVVGKTKTPSIIVSSSAGGTLSDAFDAALSKFTQLSGNVSDDSPVSILEIPPLIKKAKSVSMVMKEDVYVDESYTN